MKSVDMTPLENATSKSTNAPRFLILIPIIIASMLAAWGMMALTTADHPYTGSGVITSHELKGTAYCRITVKEETGNEHTYQRTGGASFCQSVIDGSKVTVNDGSLSSITAP